MEGALILKSILELDDADELVLDELQKGVDRAVDAFLTSQIVIDPARRVAMALCVLAVRANILEIRCDQEGLDDVARREILAMALRSGVSQVAREHVHRGCREKGGCEYGENLKRVATEMSARYEDPSARAAGTAGVRTSASPRVVVKPTRRRRKAS